MTPTVEEIEVERMLGHAFMGRESNQCVSRIYPLEYKHTEHCHDVAHALAVRVKEAGREARREALREAEKLASDIAEKAEEKQGYYGDAAATADEIADKLGALVVEP